MKLYLIGSLRNEGVLSLGEHLRKETDWDIFDDWYAAGPEADDYWQKYELNRGRSYGQALQGHAATHVFEFDKHHLDTCDAALLVLPAGRSGHLELGYCVGLGKPGFILLDQDYMEEGRFDVMYRFADAVLTDKEQVIEELETITRLRGDTTAMSLRG